MIELIVNIAMLFLILFIILPSLVFGVLLVLGIFYQYICLGGRRMEKAKMQAVAVRS